MTSEKPVGASDGCGTVVVNVAALKARIAELEADCRLLALGLLGISPDRNTQSPEECDACELKQAEVARKHNPYHA